MGVETAQDRPAIKQEQQWLNAIAGLCEIYEFVYETKKGFSVTDASMMVQNSANNQFLQKRIEAIRTDQTQLNKVGIAHLTQNLFDLKDSVPFGNPTERLIETIQTLDHFNTRYAHRLRDYLTEKNATLSFGWLQDEIDATLDMPKNHILNLPPQHKAPTPAVAVSLTSRQIAAQIAAQKVRLKGAIEPVNRETIFGKRKDNSTLYLDASQGVFHPHNTTTQQPREVSLLLAEMRDRTKKPNTSDTTNIVTKYAIHRGFTHKNGDIDKETLQRDIDNMTTGYRIAARNTKDASTNIAHHSKTSPIPYSPNSYRVLNFCLAVTAAALSLTMAVATHLLGRTAAQPVSTADPVMEEILENHNNSKYLEDLFTFG
ncbi:MAG: hypothetical protein AAFY76_13295, partial [Cyanobacteria bacterium J06649_11]